MLVLLSFALVLVATVLLVLGLLNDNGLTFIWLSIASSVAAAVVLLIALRANKSRQAAAPSAPAPLPEPDEAPVARTAEPERELVGAATSRTAATTAVPAVPAATDPADTDAGGDEWLASDQDEWSDDEEPALGLADTDLDEAEEEDWDGEFPIADYDSLTSAQILPLLPQLYPEEYDIVEERERGTKARPEILGKLAELRAASSPVDPLADYTEPAPVAPAAPLASSAGSSTASPSAAAGTPADFPIADYDDLTIAQIRPRLSGLSAEELRQVRDREASRGGRVTLLADIDQLLGESGSGTAARRSSGRAAPSAGKKAAPAAKASAPRKTSAATAPAKRTTARSGAAKTSAKKAPAKASGTKAATKKATAKKATAKKAAPAAKQATKATTAAKATKSTAAKKASSTKRAPAKKASGTTKKSR